MEVAGLILGVAGIIVPAYQAIQSLTNRISATKNFSRKLRTLNGQIALQKKLFDNECILLFSGEFDESLVRKMLIDADHRKWRDTEFQAKFVAHLGDFFGQSVEPFRIIRETVETLESEVVKVTVEGGAKTVSCEGGGESWVLELICS